VDTTIRPLLRWTAAALALACGVLLVTGLWLVWNYRPTDGLTFVPNAYPGPSIAWIHRITIWHRWASIAAIALAIALFVEVVVAAARSRRAWTVAVALAPPVLAIAGAVSGYRIAWDQLGVWAVTVGKNMMGYDGAFDEKLRFVQVGTRRLSADTFHRWYWFHIAVVPALVVAAVILTVVVHRRRRRAAIASPADT